MKTFFKSKHIILKNKYIIFTPQNNIYFANVICFLFFLLGTSIHAMEESLSASANWTMMENDYTFINNPSLGESTTEFNTTLTQLINYYGKQPSLPKKWLDELQKIQNSLMQGNKWTQEKIDHALQAMEKINVLSTIMNTKLNAFNTQDFSTYYNLLGKCTNAFTATIRWNRSFFNSPSMQQKLTTIQEKFYILYQCGLNKTNHEAEKQNSHLFTHLYQGIVLLANVTHYEITSRFDSDKKTDNKMYFPWSNKAAAYPRNARKVQLTRDMKKGAINSKYYEAPFVIDLETNPGYSQVMIRGKKITVLNKNQISYIPKSHFNNNLSTIVKKNDCDNFLVVDCTIDRNADVFVILKENDLTFPRLHADYLNVCDETLKNEIKNHPENIGTYVSSLNRPSVVSIDFPENVQSISATPTVPIITRFTEDIRILDEYHQEEWVDIDDPKSQFYRGNNAEKNDFEEWLTESQVLSLNSTEQNKDNTKDESDERLKNNSRSLDQTIHTALSIQTTQDKDQPKKDLPDLQADRVTNAIGDGVMKRVKSISNQNIEELKNCLSKSLTSNIPSITEENEYSQPSAGEDDDKEDNSNSPASSSPTLPRKRAELSEKPDKDPNDDPIYQTIVAPDLQIAIEKMNNEKPRSQSLTVEAPDLDNNNTPNNSTTIKDHEDIEKIKNQQPDVSNKTEIEKKKSSPTKNNQSTTSSPTPPKHRLSESTRIAISIGLVLILSVLCYYRNDISAFILTQATHALFTRHAPVHHNTQLTAPR